jgi:predicted dehydrogenase
MPKQTSLIKGVCIGAGYFSDYHLDAWRRIPQVELTAICDVDPIKAKNAAEKHGIKAFYTDYKRMISVERPDFVDIITPPPSHVEICAYAAQEKIDMICQKPLAPTYDGCERILNVTRKTGVHFMVHENWRWQPWYREIHRLIRSGNLGRVFSAYFRMRTGDGQGPNAYLNRQPYFRDYTRFLIYETGVHFIDTFRFLFGEIETVYARVRGINPAVRGEDSCQIMFGHTGGGTTIFDANRYNECEAVDPRLTFGNLRIDASGGHLELDTDGIIRIKSLGSAPIHAPYTFNRQGFAGDSVHAMQAYFIRQLERGSGFQSNINDYLKAFRIMEACYASAQHEKVIDLRKGDVQVP